MPFWKTISRQPSERLNWFWRTVHTLLRSFQLFKQNTTYRRDSIWTTQNMLLSRALKWGHGKRTVTFDQPNLEISYHKITVLLTQIGILFLAFLNGCLLCLESLAAHIIPFCLIKPQVVGLFHLNKCINVTFFSLTRYQLFSTTALKKIYTVHGKNG